MTTYANELRMLADASEPDAAVKIQKIRVRTPRGQVMAHYRPDRDNHPGDAASRAIRRLYGHRFFVWSWRSDGHGLKADAIVSDHYVGSICTPARDGGMVLIGEARFIVYRQGAQP